MRPTTVTVGPLASAVANNIALTQTPASTVTINGSTATGGVATLDTPRRVLITPTGDEHLNVFTITGTGLNGTAQTEIIKGTNASAFYTNLDFLTVSSIALSAAAANALTVGTNGVGSSQWVRLDEWASAQVAVQCTASGTVNYTIQQTMQDPNSPTNPVVPYSVAWISTADTGGVGATGTVASYFAYAPIFVKVLLNSGTGSVSTVVSQLGVAPY